MLDEHLLGGGGAALHAVEHDHVGARLHAQLDVVRDAGGADLDEHRYPVVGDLAQLLDLDRQIVRSHPVGVPARRALIDPCRQGPHPGDPFGDLEAQQHAAAAGFRALTDDDLHGIGAAQVVRVEAVPRRQALVDERLGGTALLDGHAAVAGGGRRADGGGGTSQRLLHVGRQRPEAHAGDGDRRRQGQRALRPPCAQQGLRRAALAVPLQRVTRHRRGQERQVVEAGHAPLCAEPADVVDPRLGGALDVVQGGRVVVVAHLAGPARLGAVPWFSHVQRPSRSGRPGKALAVRTPVVELLGGADTLERVGILIPAGAVKQLGERLPVLFTERLLTGVGAQSMDAAAHVDHRFVQRVAESRTGIAADDDAPGLSHEGAHVADAAADDDVTALEGDPTP